MAESKESRSNSHETGSLRDGTAKLEGQNGPTRDDAIAQGQADAKTNHKAEQDENSVADTRTLDETIEDAQKTAELNRSAELDNQGEGVEHDLTNDTSKKAKEATAKSQLDPNGDDPIKDSEVRASATDASMETGNKTAVTNKEAADRSRRPGEAEENSDRSLAGDGPTPARNATSDKVSEDSTSNRSEVKAAEKEAGRPDLTKSDATSGRKNS